MDETDGKSGLDRDKGGVGPKDQASILNFYNGGTDSAGNSGVNYGIQFGVNTLALKESDPAANFALEPSPGIADEGEAHGKGGDRRHVTRSRGSFTGRDAASPKNRFDVAALRAFAGSDLLARPDTCDARACLRVEAHLALLLDRATGQQIRSR